MTSRIRNEFARDVCSSIRAHTLYPTKTEREQVALMVKQKYPFLADKLHRTKKRICIKFAWCKYVANMKFAKLCNQCKGGNGRICTKTGKLGHCHLCTGCKALQISYLQHICTRQIWGKFNFSSSAWFWHCMYCSYALIMVLNNK